MSGSHRGTPRDYMSPPGVGSSPVGGARLFSPTGSEGAHERAMSILPGVQPRDGSGSSTYSNRRGRPNYGRELTQEAPPVFGLAGQSSRGSGRPGALSTPGNQMTDDFSTSSVSPSTATLMRTLKVLIEKSNRGDLTEDLHPGVQRIAKVSTDVVDRIWKLRGTAKTSEAEKIMDMNLIPITRSILDEFNAAEKVIIELDNERQKSQKLDEEAARTRVELDRMSQVIERQKAKFEQYVKDTGLQIKNLTISVKKAEEREQSLLQTIRELQNKVMARDQSIKSFPEQFQGQLNLGSPAPATAQGRAAAYGSGRASSFASPVPAPSTASWGSGRTEISAGRSSLRPSASEFQQQVLASASSADRRVARPSGASDFGSPQPKHSSPVLSAGPRVQSEDVKLWRGEFEDFFTKIRAYTANYWKHTPREFASMVQNESTGVWQHLLKAVHPTNPEAAQALVARLASERPSVPFLVERLIKQFVVEEILCLDAWMGWDSATDHKWRQIEQRLNATDLSNTRQRLAIIDERITMVNERLTHEKWSDWKNYRQTSVFQKLRTLIAPIAAPLKEKKEAIYDLFSVVEDAWELSPKIMNSQMSFSFDFPLPSERLTNDVQNVIDTFGNAHRQQFGPSALVHRGGAGGVVGGAGRFVVTPRIMMRDERLPGAPAILVAKPDVLLRQ